MLNFSAINREDHEDVWLELGPIYEQHKSFKFPEGKVEGCSDDKLVDGDGIAMTRLKDEFRHILNRTEVFLDSVRFSACGNFCY
ncbi:hypothetical protein EV1_038277 [Malus domestica]